MFEISASAEGQGNHPRAERRCTVCLAGHVFVCLRSGLREQLDSAEAGHVIEDPDAWPEELQLGS